MAAASADAAREMTYVDLHFHLLPGVDDGPGDMDASLELARRAVADGTGTVVATPHVRTDFGMTDPVEIHARVLELRGALGAAGIPLEVRCGGELGHELVGRMRQSELELIAQGPPGRRWLLVETPFDGIGDGLPRSHRRAARSRLRRAGRPPRAQRRRQPRRSRRPARASWRPARWPS